MTYKALYRTWRPQKFCQIIGQDHITRTLVNALTRGTMAHAYLFCGPRGTGKTSAAKILARAVNCEDPCRGEPCGVCPSCLEIMAGRGVDVLEIDAASNRGIDEIRDLREKVRYAPARLKVKVYIIDEVHMLTAEAFNALLKTLEEPPTRVLFILATTEPHKLPPTILSRCQRFDFSPLEVQVIASHLAAVAEKEGRRCAPEALLALARSSGGGMRDALSLLEQALAFSDGELQEEEVLQVLGQAGWHYFLELAEKTAASDIKGCLDIIDAVTREGKDLNQFARDLLAFFRDLTLAGTALEDSRLLGGYTPERQEALKKMASSFTPESLVILMEEINAIINEMKWSEQPRLILEVGFFRLCYLPSRFTLREAMERIADLEEKASLLWESREARRPPGNATSESGGVKREAVGKNLSREPAPVREPLPPGPHGDVSLEEATRAWREILKRVKKENSVLYALIRDAFVADCRKSLLILAFRKNSDFYGGLLDRRRADIAFLEKQLGKVLDRDISIKISREERKVAGSDAQPPGGEEEDEKRPPEGGREEPPPPGEESRGEGEDLLVESARDIFNGNIIE